MSIVHSRADVHAVVDAFPLLVSRLCALAIDRSGVVDPTTGERRGGLVVTAGVHDRPGTHYRLVTQPRAVDAATLAQFVGSPIQMAELAEPRSAVTTEIELRANDRRSFVVAAKVAGPSSHELTLAINEPQRLGTVEMHSTRRLTEKWPLRGGLTIVATADLAQIHDADSSSSAAAAQLRHRRLAGSATLTVSEADDDSIRFSIRADVRGRGVYRPVLAAGSLLFAGKLRRAIAKSTDDAMAEWRKKRAIAGAFDATTIADSMLAEGLSLVVPEVVTDSSGPGPR